MYTVKTKECFDAAHFLAGYNGKCRNLHGHRWQVEVQVQAQELDAGGMVVDFTDLKKDLRQLAEEFDHCMIIEKGSLRESTMKALAEEQFRVVEVPFRPTAERFAKYFYERLYDMGHAVKKTCVFETPNNCASYEK